MDKGYIHIYFGDGKGKTTAAFGLALRAAGQEYCAAVIQFLKSGGFSGEILASRHLVPFLSVSQFGKECRHAAQIKKKSMECRNCVSCLFNPGDLKDRRRMKTAIRAGWKAAQNAIFSRKYDLVVLDEIGSCLGYGMLSPAKLAGVLQKKPPGMEIVLTGRRFPPELLEYADYVTEMKDVKHPYRRGLTARRGIEY